MSASNEAINCLAKTELATSEYADLMFTTMGQLNGSRRINYLPFTPEQVVDGVSNVAYPSEAELPRILADTDTIICLSRDEGLDPDYDDAYPEHNIVLTPSGAANVDTAVQLFHSAREAGNESITFIATGRMHNRAVRMMLAMPVIADLIGLNAEDVYHVSEPMFSKLVTRAFTQEDLTLETDDEMLAPNFMALKTLLADPKYSVAPLTEDNSEVNRMAAARAIMTEHHEYPRISTSRLMIERAVQLGVPPEAIFEEDGAVDTITNILFTAQMMESLPALQDMNRVAIVAGSDHLPRSTWITDHILPKAIEIVAVESDPSLNAADYAASCARELQSFRKGSQWIANARTLPDLEVLTEQGYFGVERTDATELAYQVAKS